jgi:hypothetical protein
MDKKEIADYLAKKLFSGEINPPGTYIMLKNKQIYSVDDYGRLVKSYKISPEDAFVYNNITIRVLGSYKDHIFMYLFPLMVFNGALKIMRSYLFKLGFYDTYYGVYPATGLKYYAVVVLFSDRLVIELTDIDTMATNTGLRKIVADVLGKGILTQNKITWDQINEIQSKLTQQKLFAEHDLDEAYHIIINYYEKHKTSLAKEVLAIANDYNKIFEPYRVVYDTKTRRQVLM